MFMKRRGNVIITEISLLFFDCVHMNQISHFFNGPPRHMCGTVTLYLTLNKMTVRNSPDKDFI